MCNPWTVGKRGSSGGWHTLLISLNANKMGYHKVSQCTKSLNLSWNCCGHSRIPPPEYQASPGQQELSQDNRQWNSLRRYIQATGSFAFSQVLDPFGSFWWCSCHAFGETDGGGPIKECKSWIVFPGFSSSIPPAYARAFKLKLQTQ